MLLHLAAPTSGSTFPRAKHSSNGRAHEFHKELELGHPEDAVIQEVAKDMN